MLNPSQLVLASLYVLGDMMWKRSIHYMEEYLTIIQDKGYVGELVFQY